MARFLPFFKSVFSTGASAPRPKLSERAFRLAFFGVKLERSPLDIAPCDGSGDLSWLSQAQS